MDGPVPPVRIFGYAGLQNDRCGLSAPDHRYIYAPRPYYQRVRTFLREYHPPKMSTSINWQNLRAFIHSSLRLGIFGSERYQYWYLLLWTFFRRPAALQTAVTLAIYGHHFRKTCEVIGL